MMQTHYGKLFKVYCLTNACTRIDPKGACTGVRQTVHSKLFSNLFFFSRFLPQKREKKRKQDQGLQPWKVVFLGLKHGQLDSRGVIMFMRSFHATAAGSKSTKSTMFVVQKNELKRFNFESTKLHISSNRNFFERRQTQIVNENYIPSSIRTDKM